MTLPPASRRARLATVAALALVAAAVFAAYLPALDGEFLLDDLNLLSDPLVVAPGQSSLSDWVQDPRPLAALLFAANHAAVGFDTRGWHLTNVAVHAGALLLAFWLARRLLARAGLARPAGPALAVAAVFALHPLQSESVAYLTQRAEALASALVMAALVVLLRRDETTSPRARAGLLCGAAALQLLGLLVKPIAATVPALWLAAAATLPTAADHALPAWRRVTSRLPAALPLLGLSAVAALRGIGGTSGAIHAGFDVPRLPWDLYLATQCRAIPTYLRLAAWPSGQCGDWSFPASASFLEPAVLAGGLFLAALLGGAVLLARWAERAGRATPAGANAATAAAGHAAGDAPAAARAVAYGVLLFFLALAPSSSVIPILDPLAEHRLYLPLLGLALGISAGAAVLLRRLAGSRALPAGALLAAVLCLALAAGTWQRSGAWSSRLAFWSDVVEKAPGKARAHMNLGQALYDQQRPADALEQFLKARDLRGDHSVSGELLFQNIVGTLLTLGRAHDAEAEVRQALAGDGSDPLALALLSNVAFVAGDDAGTERAALAALQRPSRRATQSIALKYLGMSRLRRGDARGALEPLRAAAASHVVDGLMYLELGRAEAETGDLARACAAWQVARSQPGNGWASNLARQSAAEAGCR